MVSGRGWMAFLMVMVMFCAGCFAPESEDDGGPVDCTDLDPIVNDHGPDGSHGFPHNHQISCNIAEVGWNPLFWDFDDGRGITKPLANAEVYVVGNYAYLAGYDRMTIVDVSDPTEPVVVGAYSDPNTFINDVKVTPDGNWAVITNQNFDGGIDPNPGGPMGSQTENAVDLIDISDKSDPRWESSLVPTDLELDTFGPHNNFWWEDDGVRWLFTINYDGSQEIESRHGVVITRFVDRIGPFPAHLQYRARYSVDPATTGGGRIFPHDMYVETHPLTQQDLMYVAYWDAGLRIVDVDDPTGPIEIGKFDDFDVELEGNIHYARPHPGLIDGRHITVIAPEFRSHDSETGRWRIMDTTDPTLPVELANWTLPNGFGGHPWTADDAFMFSPHNMDLRDGIIYAANYHAGIWMIDINDPFNPTTLGYFLAHNEPFPEDPEFDYNKAPMNWGVIYEEPYMYISDWNTGLYVAEYNPSLN